MLNGAESGRPSRLPTVYLLVVPIWIIAFVAGCRQGKPIIDPTPGPVQADGTISGSVRGPDAALEGRTIEVINVETGERQKASTNNAGGFTFKVRPGKYRVTLALRAGEVLVKQPSIIDVNRSDVDAFADFVLGSSGVMRQRSPSRRGDDGLGAPIA